MADGDTIETMTAAVSAAEEWADWVVVTVHWGVNSTECRGPKTSSEHKP